MLFLNIATKAEAYEAERLTVTNVVFECSFNIKSFNSFNRLTVTNVVFEFRFTIVNFG